MKYVLVSGGVVSGLGKGIAASSIGVLLKACGLNVTCIKIDPYLNVDAGTMSPYEHGEVFVLDDGGEVDLDLGNYERFLHVTLTSDHNLTTGKIYQHVIDRERRGDYLGKTVQIVPHLTDAIQQWIERVANIPVDDARAHAPTHGKAGVADAKAQAQAHTHSKAPDVCVIELGGTVDDIETGIFLQSLRQFAYRMGKEHFCHVHVSLVPVVGAVGEPKTKPTQNAVKTLMANGLHPDIIIARSTMKLERSVTSKIAMACMVPPSHVLSVYDVSNIYKVPLLMLEHKIHFLILGCLKMHKLPPETLPLWERLVSRMEAPVKPVTIGIVGKYTGLADSYLSITRALGHAAVEANVRLTIEWIDSEHLQTGGCCNSSSKGSGSTANADEKKEPKHNEQGQMEKQVKIEPNCSYSYLQSSISPTAATTTAAPATASSQSTAGAWALLRKVDGILIPGGFGERGACGKIRAAQYARENKVPFLGICLGMQIAVIEYARAVLGLRDAHSTEFDSDTNEPVIMFMPEGSATRKGATMRLGSRCSTVKEGTLCYQLYGGESHIEERHRHRYEVNPEYVERLEKAGLVFSALDDTGVRCEVVELPESAHPFFLGTQYHPEFKSKPLAPSPPFVGFMQAAANQFVRKTPTSTSTAKSKSILLGAEKHSGSSASSSDSTSSFELV